MNRNPPHARRRPSRGRRTTAFELLERRQLLAITASVTSGELRIGFTSSALAEQVARLSSDGTNYTVRNTNNISIGSFAVSAVNLITVSGLAAVERFEISSTSTREITDPISVTATVETTVIGRAITVASGGVQIASPAITLAAAVTTAAGQTYAGNVTLATGSLATTSTAGGDIRFESSVTGVSGSELVIDTSGAAAVLGGLGGPARLIKRGAGGLRLPSTAGFNGGTSLEAGDLAVTRTGGLGAGGLQIAPTARLKLDAGTALIDVASLSVAAGGRIDIGVGGLRVAAGGYDLATVRGLLTAGYAGGSWSGTSGIVSHAAAMTSGRGVGATVEGDGSLRIAFAAIGDTNVDGVVDVLDVSGMLAGGYFDSGLAASWIDGDTNYDNVVDILDVAHFLSAALYDTGPYLPVTAVPSALSESWEALATTTLPNSAWQLQTGGWGTIDQQDFRGAGRKHAVAAGHSTRLMRPIDLAGQDHVVLQGWLFSSGSTDRSMLGLASFPTVTNNALVQMGATGKSTYRIEYGNLAAGSTPIEIDTTLPVEAGWHFMRLDLIRDTADATLWQATWRGWNTARTIEKTQSFSWRFDSAGVNWATLGSAAATSGAVAWDNVDIGPLGRVGPPAPLPATPPTTVTASASSFLPGWEPAKLIDSNAGTTYSSNGHGANPSATEWAAIDLGSATSVNALTLTPRAGGACFPVDYEIQYSTDLTHWTTVPGQVHVGQERPASYVTHTFATAVMARGLRVFATRLGTDGPDNSSGNHYLQLSGLEVPRFKLDRQSWVKPAELRGKSLNSTGIFSNTQFESDVSPTPKFLAENPQYLANHPFDGVTVPLMIDKAYLESQGIVSSDHVAFQWIGMSSMPIPWSAVSQSVDYLKRVNWGRVTDNFLWYGVQNTTNDSWEDGDRKWWVDHESAADWNVVVANAGVAARAAREGGLKGFIIDTEQYTRYPTGDRPEYPFGLGTAQTWRDRGRQWIEAVQAEFPDIELQFFFSWGDEHIVWSNYQNLVPFMDGVLAGIRDPARIVHAWESSFWWGMARAVPPGSSSFNMYDGDRDPYIAARDSIRNLWRNYSNDPKKYDDFVDVGMAAWFESDPWNLWPGWPSGYLNESVNWGRSTWPCMPWSNVANTLAYSDKYVWTWSGNSHYAATANSLNPFLASIGNQTFNTGVEQVAAFTDDFTTDPMRRGWYFNFSFMDIGRRPSPDDGPPQLVQTTDAVAYAWKQADGAIAIRGNWNRGEFSEVEGLAAPQQRRYVKPVVPQTRADDIHVEADLTIDSFGTDGSNPILVGLFHSDAAVDAQSLCLRIGGASDVSVVVAGDGTPVTVPLAPAAPLTTGTGYRVVLNYAAATRTLTVTLRSRAGMATVASASTVLPSSVGPFVLDEAGVAQREQAFSTTAAQAYRFRLEALAFGATLPAPSAAAATEQTETDH